MRYRQEDGEQPGKVEKSNNLAARFIGEHSFRAWRKQRVIDIVFCGSEVGFLFSHCGGPKLAIYSQKTRTPRNRTKN